MKLRIYSDGASRGNPGPSSIAFLILLENGEKLAEESKCIGTNTNNQAEYKALISALEFASELNHQEVSCYTDSELVVKQLRGEYRIKDPKLLPLWLKVQELEQRFKKITFMYTPRTEIFIQMVDKLANEVLDVLDKSTTD